MSNKGPKTGASTQETQGETEDQNQVGLFGIASGLNDKTKQLEQARKAYEEEAARLSGIGMETDERVEGEEEDIFHVATTAPREQDIEQEDLNQALQASVDDDNDDEIEQDEEEELDVSEAAIDLVASTRKVFAQLGKVDADALEAGVEKRLGESMDQRIKALPPSQELMESDSFSLYSKNFMSNPFDALGEALKNNKDNPDKAFALLDFMVRGARCAAVEISNAQEAKKQAGQEIKEPEKAMLLDAKAKLMALEEVQSVLNSMRALEKNNCRYSKTEYAKKIAQIQAMLTKTNINPDAQMIFARQLRDVLENFKYSERQTVGSAIKQVADSALLERHKFHPKAEYNASRGRNEFDTRKDSMAMGRDISRSTHIKERLLHPETIAKLNTIKVGHSEQGKVVHLSFSFDRTKILKGNEKEFNKMKKQVNDALTISITEYGKGSMDNPISISYRPPTLIQPELGFAMLLNLKEKAIEEGKSFYVKDPKDPEKTIEFTSNPKTSDDEMACFTHYGRELGTGARCDVVELLTQEKNVTDEEFRGYMDALCQNKAQNRKADTQKNDADIVKEYDKSKKMRT